MTFVDRSETFAALDLGTTNCRLLIARPSRDGLRITDSFSRIVRLGEGLERSGVLSNEAMKRAVDALAICATKIGANQVTRHRYVATEACRRAANCPDFVQKVFCETGLILEIIETGEEARLAVAGCAPLLDPLRAHAVVFDIGGGSTEISWVLQEPMRGGGSRPRIRGVVSVPFGVVSLTERYRHRSSARIVYDEMVEEVAQEFAAFEHRWGIGKRIRSTAVQMLGSSGTVTTLAGIKAALPRYERGLVDGSYLDFDDIARISAALVGMSPGQRAAEPCIGASRADLMVAGCAILEAICRTWPVGQLRVADRGVREGILAGLLDESRQRRWRQRPGAWHMASRPVV